MPDIHNLSICYGCKRPLSEFLKNYAVYVCPACMKSDPREKGTKLRDVIKEIDDEKDRENNDGTG